MAARPERGEKPAEAPRAGGGEGTLRIQSKPWTKITVDGKDCGTTPLRDYRVAAGRHRVSLVNPGFSINESFAVDIKANETETVIKDFRQQPPPE